MTKDEIKNVVEKILDTNFGRTTWTENAKDLILLAIDKHVKDVIGKDDPDWRKAQQHSGIMWTTGRNELRADQRKRAEL